MLFAQDQDMIQAVALAIRSVLRRCIAEKARPSASGASRSLELREPLPFNRRREKPRRSCRLPAPIPVRARVFVPAFLSHISACR